MGVTAIKYFKNFGNESVTVYNRENHRTYLEIPPGQSRSMDEYVPFCTNQGDFDNQHFIEVRQNRKGAEDLVYSIWQRDVSGDDRVRFAGNAEVPVWTDPGERVPGVSMVDGNRVLFWQSDDTLLVERSG